MSKLVNDLLQHNRDSGTFLQSYYAVEYACKPEGQAVLKSQLECLREHHMGDKLLAEVSRLYDHFAKHKVDTPPEERDETWTADNCNKLTNSADQFDQNTNQKCGDMAGVLICKSFASPFLNIQPELFGFNCAPCEHNEATAEPDVTPILSELDSNEGETDEPAEEEEATTPVVRESGENSEEHHDATVPTVQAATEAPKRQNGAEKLITSFVSLPFALFIILLSFNRA